MDAYNADPRGLRKRKRGVEKLLEEYPLPIAGVAVFLCVCVIVALHGRAGYWQRLAKEHEGHHHRFRASHSTLQQALQVQAKKMDEWHGHKQTSAERIAELQHRLEAEARGAAGARTELQGAQAELREARQALTAAKHDLNTCLDQVKSHGDSSGALQQQVAELKQRVAAHESRELQLLSAKQELEQLVERWRTQAEAKGLHLTAPAGLAAGAGLSGGSGAALGSLPTSPVPSAPSLDGIRPAAAVLGVQPTAAVPQAPLVVEHLDLPKLEAQERERRAAAAPNL